MASNQLKNQHLLWRAGFGPAAEGLNQLSLLSPQELYAALKVTSAKTPEYLDVTEDHFKGLVKGIQEEGARRELEKGAMKAAQPQSRQEVQNLNIRWLDEMVHSPAQLREKVAFFWHGHFASRNLNVYFQQLLLDSIRTHALGSFRDMLHEVSKSAAILFFLNAAQNVKKHPNENFAREVMELFTLGRGHYTEQDVKEAARAFTGWSANLKGEFIFRKNDHDAGTKTVLGITGALDGEDVIDILLSQKQTAAFIAEKAYRFFVNEKVDATKVTWLADRFYQSDYNIGALMDDVFLSDWFYEERNVGTRIKSPVELLVGIRRLLPMELSNPESQLVLQRLLGQVLFMPPNVAGWPGGRQWIDSSTVLYRMRLPMLLAGEDDWNAAPKENDDITMGREDRGTARQKTTSKAAAVAIAWKEYTRNFGSVPRERLIESIAGSVLQAKPSFPAALIQKAADSSNREAFVQSATLRLMATPEFQLC